MKKTVFITTVVMMFSLATICSASPLMDFSQGKGSVDLTIRSGGDVTVSAEGQSVTGDGKSTNFEGTITYGLGNNFAVQYRHTTGDSKKYNGYIGEYDVSGNTTSTAQEFNVLYKLDKNVAAFIGWTQAKAGLEGTAAYPYGFFVNSERSGSVSIPGNSVNGYQVGLTGVANLGSGFNGFATIAAGNHITNWEVGVGYEIAKNCELNVGYKDTKYKDLSISYGGDSYSGYDYELKGLTYGVTFKF